jgi:hypothetical protein
MASMADSTFKNLEDYVSDLLTEVVIWLLAWFILSLLTAWIHPLEHLYPHYQLFWVVPTSYWLEFSFCGTLIALLCLWLKVLSNSVIDEFELMTMPRK